MEGREATQQMAATTGPHQRTGAPGAAEFLRAALEKIVFFEWRLAELTAELAAAQSRCAAAEAERQRAHEEARRSALEAQEARRHTVELEAERARLATLLARPAHTPVIDEAALVAERDRTAQLSAELAAARAEVSRQKDERARWLQEMIEQARQGDEAPAALAQFISELRGQVLELRDRQRLCDAMLAQAGLAPPAPLPPSHPAPAPAREHDAVSQARRLFAEGRLGEIPGRAPREALDGAASGSIGAGPDASSATRIDAAIDTSPSANRADARGAPAAVGTDLLPGLAALQRSPAAAAAPLPSSDRPIPAAQRALVEQCLRGLTSSDAARRAQAARHLAALPLPAAAPGLAAALGRESDPRARAAIARALAACGGDGAAALIAQLQAASEPALVRMAALDALSGMDSQHARAALEAAAFDDAPSLRRRAAALALSFGPGAHGDLLARLSVDPDASVRAAAGGEGSVPEAPLAAEEFEPAPGPVAPDLSAALTRIDLPVASATPAAPLAPPFTSPLAAAPRPAAAPPLASSAAGSTSSSAASLLAAAAPRAAPDAQLAQEALFAVRAAMLGLTEQDLAAALGLPAARTESLVHQLIAQGLLARRGKRLIAGAAVESASA